VTVDVVCADPAFLDLTFTGLAALPRPGAELFARDLHESPGGAAITAIGLARLGSSVAVTAPIGSDAAGRTLRALLELEGVLCAGPDEGRTPVTVVVPLDGDRALLSYAPEPTVDAEAIARLRPRAVVVNAERAAAVPDGPAVYAVLGHPEAERLAAAPPELSRARALIANRSEAARVTGMAGPEAAARALAERVPAAVVSCGGDGAVAVAGGEVVHAPAPPVEAVDTTGAGDLLAAAYVWADLGGVPLAERVRRAVVYASLSVAHPTGAGGAATRAELEAALSL
jgi:sugar/nucleoside kinase (ribokinase family)